MGAGCSSGGLTSRVADLEQRNAVLETRVKALSDRESNENAQPKGRSYDRESGRESGRESDAGSAGSKKKTVRQTDPIDDVPALYDSYMTNGGVVPLGVLVAEVEALQQAATRLEAAVTSSEQQIGQLDEVLALDIHPQWLGSIRESRDQLEVLKEEKMQAARLLKDRYTTFRDTGVARFVPMLLQTVAMYDAAFEGQLTEAGEAALEHVATMCAPFKAKGRSMRQHLPSALPKEHLGTLMQLMGLAIQAAPKIKELAEDCIDGREGCVIMFPSKPTKGMARALQKTQEEYEGDYTRILDYARVSIVCETLKVLAECCEWLVSAERAPRFVVVRTKDRLSREWDAEESGGNRDVMLNGWLALGGGRKLVVEVQLHLQALFELKHSLHVLYVGARVLGAMEEATTSHKGVLSDQVLERVESGVVRSIRCPCAPISVEHRDRLVEAMKTEPCALLGVDLDYATCEGTGLPVFDHWTVARVLEPSTGTLACRRLRVITLGAQGLVGPIPDCMSLLKHVQHFSLGLNALSGEIPHWLGEFKSMRILWLGHNAFTGTIPEAIGQCARLEEIDLNDNKLSGVFPAEAFTRLTHLKALQIGSRPKESRESLPEPLVQYLKDHGTWYEGATGNQELTITAAGKEAIEKALPNIQRVWWPKVVGTRNSHFNPFASREAPGSR